MLEKFFSAKILEYFPNRNYTSIYLFSIADGLADKFIEIFSGAFLYSLGMPLPLVLLYYGLEFGIMGAFTPLGPMLVARWGVIKSFTLSYVFMILYFASLVLATKSLWIGFFGFIFYGLARAINHPSIDGLRSALVSNTDRGKQYSLETVLKALAAIAAAALGVLLGSHIGIVAIIFILSCVMAVSSFSILREFPRPQQVTFAEPYKYLFSNSYRENLLPIAGQALAIIAIGNIAPLLIFLVVGNFKILGLVVALSVVLDMLVVIFYGRAIDKSLDKKSSATAGLQGLGMLGYIFLVKSPISAFIINSYNRISWNIYNSSYSTRLDRKGLKTSQPFMFGAAHEMNLCFVEVVVLSLFAYIAYLFGKNIFAIVFLSSIIGLYLYTRYFID